jgi:hypothetical protein
LKFNAENMFDIPRMMNDISQEELLNIFEIQLIEKSDCFHVVENYYTLPFNPDISTDCLRIYSKTAQTFLYPLFLDAMFCNCVAQTRLSSDITVLSQRHIVFVLKDNKTQISHWLSNTPDEK